MHRVVVASDSGSDSGIRAGNRTQLVKISDFGIPIACSGQPHELIFIFVVYLLEEILAHLTAVFFGIVENGSGTLLLWQAAQDVAGFFLGDAGSEIECAQSVFRFDLRFERLAVGSIAWIEHLFGDLLLLGREVSHHLLEFFRICF